MTAQERFGLGISNCRTVAGVVADVREAERRGAEIAFVAEDINCRDAFQILALCAAKTERIRLSTGVANPYTRNPTSLAMAAATLDQVSQGRATLGIGSGSPDLMAEMGIATDRSVRVLREATEIIRTLLAGEAAEYVGAVFRYHGAQLSVRPVQSRLPIVLAAMGPATLKLAGRLADGVLLNVGASTEYVRWAVGQIRQGATAAGRPLEEITVAAWLSVYVSDDRDDALRRARQGLATMLSVPRQGELLLEHSEIDSSILGPIRRHVSAYPHTGDPAAAAPYVPEEVAERLALVGTLDEVWARLAAYREAGVQLPVLGPLALKALYP